MRYVRAAIGLCLPLLYPFGGALGAQDATGEDALAIAREALAVAVDARSAGDLGPAREYAQRAVEALGGIAADAEASEVRPVAEELAGLAEALHLVGVERAAREWLVADLERTRPEEDEELLRQ